MIITLESPEDHAALLRSLVGIRAMLGTSVTIQIVAPDGVLVDAADIEQLLRSPVQQRWGVRRQRTLMQGLDHPGQVQQLDGEVVHPVSIQSRDHGL